MVLYVEFIILLLSWVFNKHLYMRDQYRIVLHLKGQLNKADVSVDKNTSTVLFCSVLISDSCLCCR